jgi:hypothetical protein
MSDIVKFIKARLDDDERYAKGATPGDWRDSLEEVAFDYLDYVVESGDEEVSVSRGDRYGHANSQYIARQDPVRALREVEAKRAIVADLEHAENVAEMEAEAGRSEESWAWEAKAASLYGALTRLAAVYNDHPDYRHEWGVDSQL